MSFLIRPLESVIDPVELVCCIDGKTPTEYYNAIDQEFEEVVDNGDGTFTTTWTYDSPASPTFKVCCKQTVTVTSITNVTLSVFVAGEQTESVATGESKEVNFNDDTTPGPCGVVVELDTFADGAGGISFSITI